MQEHVQAGCPPDSPAARSRRQTRTLPFLWPAITCSTPSTCAQATLVMGEGLEEGSARRCGEGGRRGEAERRRRRQRQAAAVAPIEPARRGPPAAGCRWRWRKPSHRPARCPPAGGRPAGGARRSRGPRRSAGAAGAPPGCRRVWECGPPFALFQVRAVQLFSRGIAPARAALQPHWTGGKLFKRPTGAGEHRCSPCRRRRRHADVPCPLPSLGGSALFPLPPVPMLITERVRARAICMLFYN